MCFGVGFQDLAAGNVEIKDVRCLAQCRSIGVQGGERSNESEPSVLVARILELLGGHQDLRWLWCWVLGECNAQHTSYQGRELGSLQFQQQFGHVP